MTIRINGKELMLLPERALFLREFGALCIADWHLGKAAHFRKSGIPVPQPDLAKEFGLVARILAQYQAKHVFFLGDLFHSLKNNDWNEFADFLHRCPGVSFTLVRGNHDLIADSLFTGLGVGVSDRLLLGENLILTHEPLYKNTPTGLLNIAGHIHPGYQVRLKARQQITLPCFHYREQTLVLPAFGSLTGLYRMSKAEGEAVYCILGDEVVAV